MAVYRLSNTIQEYSWGSTTAIPELLGIAPDPDAPKAELWMGAHPKAPSRIATEGGPRSLLEAIRDDPETFIGADVSRRFSGSLPFLFKVLAAGQSLSIQAHPTKPQAEEGFDREDSAGIPVDAPERNYRDRNHKPEVVCALSEFHAMCGFRPPEVIRDELADADSGLIADAVSRLGAAEEQTALEHFLVTLLSSDRRSRTAALSAVLGTLESRTDDRAKWVRVLHEEHPGDLGAIAPLFLNVVRLDPGEALYLDAGVLHAYLRGTSVELMANSDNVLRGGLTEKHVDVKELVNVLRFEHFDPQVLHCSGNGACTYPTPAPEFELSRVVPRREPASTVELPGGVPSVLICVEGSVSIRWDRGSLDLDRGASAFVCADTRTLEVSGDGSAFRASTPEVR